MFLRILLTWICVLLPSLSSAHELWVEPTQWQVAKGAQIAADLRNGENFKGGSLMWYPTDIARAEIAFGETRTAFEGRMGDRPALVAQAETAGLAAILYETNPSKITYRTWAKFAKFVAHKDLSITQATHLSKGHPEKGFTESYTRHVKALIRVGDGAGTDRAYGLQTEFIALTNPYAAGFDGAMRLKLEYLRKPRSDVQIEVFARDAKGSVEVTLARTDAQGQATLPVKSGHTYLLDSVVIRDGTQDGAIYDTLWAGLTFYVP